MRASRGEEREEGAWQVEYFRLRCRSWVRRTIADLEKELQGKRKELEEKLGHSKAKSVAKIMVFYREMTQELTKLQEERKREVEENCDSVLAAEKKALWAEYGLDFAMQVANSALLAALKAVDAQLTLEEKNR